MARRTRDAQVSGRPPFLAAALLVVACAGNPTHAARNVLPDDPDVVEAPNTPAPPSLTRPSLRFGCGGPCTADDPQVQTLPEPGLCADGMAVRCEGGVRVCDECISDGR